MSGMSLRKRILGTGVLCASLLFSAGLVSANETNNIPKQWSFEGLADGTAIVDTNGVGILGWEGTPFSATTDAAVVVNAADPAPLAGYPIDGVTHSNVMQVLGTVSATFDTNGAESAFITNVYVDALVQAGRLSYQPDPPADAQLAAYFDENGLLNVYHALYTNGYGAVVVRWTTLNHPPVDSNQWVRLTFTMDYLSAGTQFPGQEEFENFFKVQIDGQVAASPFAYEATTLDYIQDPDWDGSFPLDTGDTNCWFLCADSTGFSTGPNNPYFTGLEIDGAGVLDDIIVTTAIPTFSTNQPPASPLDLWLTSNGLGGDYFGDADGDGSLNWEEFWAGTNPTNGASVFQVIAVQNLDGSNCVQWTGTTNSGVTEAFIVLRATNVAEGFIEVATGLPRDATGINTWYDTNQPAGPAWYRAETPVTPPE